MANVEGHQVPGKADPTCGGWPNLTIQGRRPCHGNTPPHDRPRRRLRIAVLREGRGARPASGKHAGPAARHRDGRLLRGIRAIGRAARLAGVIGRRVGDGRWGCVRTWARDAGGDVRRTAFQETAAGHSGLDSRSDGSSGGRGVAGGTAADARGHSALLSRSPGGENAAGAATRTRDSPDSGGRRDRTHPHRLADGLPHRDGRLAPHHRQRRPASGRGSQPGTRRRPRRCAAAMDTAAD